MGRIRTINHLPRYLRSTAQLCPCQYCIKLLLKFFRFFSILLYCLHSIPFFLSFSLSFLLANFFHHSFLTYYDSVFGFLHFLFLSLPASMLTLPFPDLETRNCSLLYVAPLKVGGCEGRKEGRKEGGMHKHTVALCKRCRPFSFEGQRREAWQSKVAFHIHSVTRAHRLKTLFLFYFFFLSLSF